MTFSSSTTNSLSNPGQVSVRPPNQIQNDRPPLPTDINANIGDEWEDMSVTPSNFYKLANLYYNIATWVLMTAGTGELISLSDTTDTPVFPSLSSDTPPNNIQLINIDGSISIVSDPPNNRILLNLAGGGEAIDSVALQTGTSPIVPTAGGLITLNGAVVAAGTNPVRSDGTGPNTAAIEVQISQAIAAADATKIGLSNFNSAQFSVTNTGFVSFAAGSTNISITGDSGGAQTASTFTFTGGTTGLTFAGAANTFTLGGTLAIANGGTNATSFTNVDGTVYYDGTRLVNASPGTSAQVWTSNGPGVAPSFQANPGSASIQTLTGNSGGAISPSAGNINTIGTGSITIAGSGSTLTTQLTGLTNHNVLIGTGTATITNVAPSATSGIPLISQGASADPAFGTAVVAGGGTGDTSFTAFSVITGGTTSTGALQNVSGVGTSGQVLTSNGVGTLPTWQASSSSGITTINGDSGSITGSSVTIFANNGSNTCGASVKFVNSSTTSTLNVTDVNLNTFIGFGAGSGAVTGTNSTGIGYRSLFLTSSGSRNTALGSQSGFDNLTGSDNCYFGANAATLTPLGSQNTIMGSSALGTATGTPTNNIAIGYQSASNYTLSESSNIIIGNLGTNAESNVIRIGTQGSSAGQQNKAFLAGITGVTTTVANRQLVTINSSTTQVGTSAFSVNQQVFTSGGTYTPTSGCISCYVSILGGGGASGGQPATGAGQLSSAGGGGGGEYAEGVFAVASLSGQTITIGAAGAGASGTTGGSGGTTSIGAVITAVGGSGGTVAGPAGAGASATSSGGLGGTGGSGGSFRTPGQPGTFGIAALSAPIAYGGTGGSSQFGAGGIGSSGATGGVGLGFGSGGGGGANGGSTAAATGRAGSAGIVIITEYVIA